MRSSLLAATLGLALVGCVGTIDGPGAADDDVENPGNPSNPNNPGQPVDPNTPALRVSVDQSAMSTELMTTNMVTVTLEGSGGFSGPVALVASAVDPAGAPIPNWTVTLDKSTIELAANGTATAVAAVTIPSDSAALAGRVKVDATSSVGTTSSSTASEVTVAKQLTYNITLNGTVCAYPAAGTVNVTSGTKIRWVNSTTTARTIIHVESQNADKINGLSHQNTGGGGSAPGAVYEQTVAGAAGESTFWYCHSPGPTVTNRRFQVVP